MALDAVAGAAGIALAMLLRFIDEGNVPATYLQRLWPWLLAAAMLQIAVGEVMNRLRKPGSVIARRPVAPPASAARFHHPAFAWWFSRE